MNFDKEKFPSGSSLNFNSKESIPSSRGRRSSADGLRETIFQAIFEKKLETDIGIEFAAPIHDPLNAEFATPATQAEDIVCTSTTIPPFEDSEVSRSQRRKKLRRSVSFDQALTIYPITPTSDNSFMSNKHGKVVKIENGDKEEEPKCSNPVSECPSESELTSEVTSISSKEPEPIPLSTYTQLLVACAKADIEKVNDIIEKHPSAVKYAYPTCYRYTPLHIAVKSGSVKLVHFLLKKGADLNAKSALWYTPLHMAAMANKVEVVDYLINKGADQEARDASGLTFMGHLSIEGKDKLNLTKYKKLNRIPSETSINSSIFSDSSFLSTTSKDQQFGSIRIGSIRKGIKGIMNMSASLAGYSRKKNTSLENLNCDFSSYSSNNKL
uniref:Uncharacterized protein n=1 Tax=Acrobeloides nanus TaxID=290746 RepID=A0A914DJ84_9BILA